METLAGPHPLTYRRLRLDLLGAVFFCRKLIMLITIANVPLTHAQMLQMASNLFTVSPPFIVYIIPRYARGSQCFSVIFFRFLSIFLFAHIEI